MRVQIVSDRAIAGSHPENADMSNPYGYYYATFYWIGLTDDNGNRYDHRNITKDKAEAEKLLSELQSQIDNGKAIDLSDDSVWCLIDMPRYGENENYLLELEYYDDRY